MEFDQRLKDSIPFIYNLAFKLTQDRTLSEDLTQETLLKAWEKRDTLRTPEALRGWLRRICTNLFLAQKRKEQGYHALSLEALTDLDREGGAVQFPLEQPLPEEEVVVSETLREMRDGCFLAMTRKLTLHQRMAFSLVEMFGVSVEEAADLMELSISAVKALVHRAHMNLDSFFAPKCNLIHVENPCSCEAYLRFAEEKADRQAAVRSRIQTFQFQEVPEGYSYDPEVRRKVRSIYAQMPERLPDPTWFTAVQELLEKKISEK